jgi:hypothetical protein
MHRGKGREEAEAGVAKGAHCSTRSLERILKEETEADYD